MKKILIMAFAALMTLSLSSFAATDDKPKADQKKEDKKKKDKKPHAF